MVMKQSIYRKLLEVTQSMLAMANNNEWKKVSVKECERQKLILTLRKKNNLKSEFMEGKQVRNVDLLKNITNLNKMIERLAKEALEKHKISLLQLQKAEKVKSLFYGKQK